MKISIITATYNSGTTLRDTMESVLSQSYTDFEHIIVDGVSKDNTLDIIKDLEPRYEGKLKWISELDKGLYDAMNKGISMASGDIIGILNSDDFYTSVDVLKTVVDNISGVDAVYGDIHYVNGDDLKKTVRYYSSKDFRRWKMRMGFMPAHPSFYCRKGIYMKYGCFDLDYRSAADFDNLLNLIYIQKIKIKYIPKDFVTMRTGGETSSGFQSYKRSYIDRKRIFQKFGLRYNVFLASVMYMSKFIDMILARVKYRNR